VFIFTLLRTFANDKNLTYLPFAEFLAFKLIDILSGVIISGCCQQTTKSFIWQRGMATFLQDAN